MAGAVHADGVGPGFWNSATVRGRVVAGQSMGALETLGGVMGAVALSGERRGLWRSRWAAVGAAVAVSLGGGGLFVANAASSAPSSVVTIDPVRILDTRDPVNIGLPGPFVSAVSQKLQVTGAAVPAGATGVLLNVTAVGPSAAGFLSVRPGDAAGAPSTSSLNFKAGDLIPNSVQVGLPTAGANAGQIDITYDAYGVAGPTTEVLIDVVGYTAANPAVYTKAEIDAKLAGLYTRTEVDTLLAGKLDNAKVLWAIVNTDGTLDKGKGALVAGTARLGIGTYQVTFERDMTACAAMPASARRRAGVEVAVLASIATCVFDPFSPVRP